MVEPRVLLEAIGELAMAIKPHFTDERRRQRISEALHVLVDHIIELATAATARAEAAEARNKVLETQVDILEQALIDHNCGSPSCLCVGCIEKRDPALGDEHGK